MSKVWVKFQSYNATQVSCEGCLNVDDFIKACKKELSPRFDSVPIDQLLLSTTEGGQPLEPDILLTDINSQPGFTENSYKHPLFLSVTSGTTRGKAYEVKFLIDGKAKEP